ncbi:GNAT family N-acetyltransferase [Solitalea longa]|uniref:GNAT family N-acetyltransferase n=1 Tax=Solitalea longa TaxID=2079460 RepID=A0A2S4ZYI1_9SPHI|nr:GNAT family N-acetyltransferase [Solitalea longa]POY35385.1 GNAT family N-acetyltransferase [Solitalea longa]
METLTVNIVDFNSTHYKAFEALNSAWIEKYFYLEPIDKEVLSKPDKYIFAHGGAIIMAEVDGQAVGTVALKRVDYETFEMTKMAVDENYRGLKIGWLLGKAILNKAKELGATKVILYSNRILVPAITMYHKLGFVEVALEESGYVRSDIKMEIDV